MTDLLQDEILFADDATETTSQDTAEQSAWKVLIVDDEDEVHRVTRLALDSFYFADRPLQFLSAYSGAEAKQLVAAHPDAAVVLLDVVMESDDAGLDVARWIREEGDNQAVRIVLRTGQPGQAPERSVIRDFDINDYKEKTELTAQKLFTLMHSCLRSHRDIVALAANKRGLEKVIDASANIFELHSMEKFTEGVIEQLTSLLGLGESALYCDSSDDNFCLVRATGAFSDYVGRPATEAVDALALTALRSVAREQKSQCGDGLFTGFCGGASGGGVFQVTGANNLSEIDCHLIELFCRNVNIAFENIHLKDEIEDTQKEIVFRLGGAVETRSRETGNHLKRVSEYAHILARGYGLNNADAEIVRLAAPLHDVGKVGIPDHVLNKPGKLDSAEWEIMQSHATLGHDMLKDSKRPVLRAGAIIAHEHHEHWNGGGYPNGKAGEDIHIYGRISALADVFDALGSRRCYKEPWEIDEILDHLRAQRGKQFEPTLVDILMSRIAEFAALRESFPD